MTKTAKKVTAWCIVTLIVVGAVVLYLYNPTEAGFYPRCPSKLLTGYDCPGCGSLRGLHALMHGDIAAAWGFNPALFVALPVLALIVIGDVNRRPFLARHLGPRMLELSRRTAHVTDHPATPIVIFIALIIWTIYRNIS